MRCYSSEGRARLLIVIASIARIRAMCDLVSRVVVLRHRERDYGKPSVDRQTRRGRWLL